MFQCLFQNMPIDSIFPSNMMSIGIVRPIAVTFFGETLFGEYIKQESNIFGTAKLLAAIGEDPNKMTAANESPFYSLCKKYGKTIPESSFGLIDEFASLPGLNLNLSNSKCKTPFLYFAKKRNEKLCRFLLEKGANPHLSDNKNRNALHWAVNNNNQNDTNFDFEEFLISNKK